MNIDFNDFKAADLNGKEYIIEDIAKNLGNALYMDSTTIELEDLARKIHKGDSFEATIDEINTLITYLEKRTVFARWVQTKIIASLKALQQIDN